MAKCFEFCGFCYIKYPPPNPLRKGGGFMVSPQITHSMRKFSILIENSRSESEILAKIQQKQSVK